MTKNKLKEAWLLYDGHCPLCRNFVLYYRVQKTINLHLVDARVDSDLLREVSKTGLNIDEGIVLKIDNILYHGSDAMNVIAFLGTKYGFLNRLNCYLFRSKIIAAVFYPILRSFRNLLLKVIGVKKINNLKN